jgi:hypothetical protein
MLRTLFCALLGLVLLAGTTLAQAPKTRKEPAKADAKDGKLVVAKVKSVDVGKGTITATTANGKVIMVSVAKTTKILGPRGGVSTKGLKDDRLAPGSEIKLLLGADGKSATEIRLGVRKKAPPKKEKK